MSVGLAFEMLLLVGGLIVTAYIHHKQDIHWILSPLVLFIIGIPLAAIIFTVSLVVIPMAFMAWSLS
ncbi:hypothetical protein [Natrinema sp. 1APR25-10V2]|uniref:hypothetical protein n=1 Tax=Natrinema sp. 1APR25-10V2 TaxID=2951081 RepID=UPI00287B8C8D|nr:hypothetical protein [Natrinema sp. 1APR25-10V2]